MRRFAIAPRYRVPRKYRAFDNRLTREEYLAKRRWNHAPRSSGLRCGLVPSVPECRGGPDQEIFDFPDRFAIRFTLSIRPFRPRLAAASPRISSAAETTALPTVLYDAASRSIRLQGE